MERLLLEKQKIQNKIENQNFLTNLNLFEPTNLSQYEAQLNNELTSRWRRIYHFTLHGLVPLTTGVSIGWTLYKICNDQRYQARLSDAFFARPLLSAFFATTVICCATGLSNLYTNIFNWRDKTQEQLGIVKRIMNRLDTTHYKNYKLLIRQQKNNDAIDKEKALTDWNQSIQSLRERKNKIEEKMNSRWKRLCNFGTNIEYIASGLLPGVLAYALIHDKSLTENTLLNTIIYRILTPTVLTTTGAYLLSKGCNGIYKDLFCWKNRKSHKIFLTKSALKNAKQLSNLGSHAN